MSDRMRFGRRFLSASILLAALSGCDRHSSRRCALNEQPMMLAQLFFGRNVGNRNAVSDAQFNVFVDRVLSRRFPAGLTRVDAIGHWRSAVHQPLARERSVVVSLVVPDSPQAHHDLEVIRQDYIARFQQESVLLTHAPVCARL